MRRSANFAIFFKSESQEESVSNPPPARSCPGWRQGAKARRGERARCLSRLFFSFCFIVDRPTGPLRFLASLRLPSFLPSFPLRSGGPSVDRPTDRSIDRPSFASRALHAADHVVVGHAASVVHIDDGLHHDGEDARRVHTLSICHLNAQIRQTGFPPPSTFSGSKNVAARRISRHCHKKCWGASRHDVRLLRFRRDLMSHDRLGGGEESQTRSQGILLELK